MRQEVPARSAPAAPPGTADLEALRLCHEQLRAENEQLVEAFAILELSLHRFAEHFDLAPFGYVTVDSGGVIREINQAACRLFAGERPHLLGGLLRSLVDESDREALAAHFAACARDGAATTRIRLLPRGGAPIPAELTSRRASGQRECYPTVVLDQRESDRRAQEREALMEVTRSALERGDAKARFLAMVSHELRSPLGPLLLVAGALRQRVPESAEIKEMSEIIQRNVEIQARLVDDLLDASRLSRGKMSLRPGPIDVHAMAREALELASTILMQKRLQVTIALEAAQSQVEGDAVRLRQLLGNLIANAVKFTPPGGDITVSSWNSPGAIALEVRDSGAGISAEALPRLFTAFEQGDRMPGSHGGLGLGLAISKGIVELHGGRISGSSEGPGRGARFVVELPLLREVAQLADGEVKARVLVVEDNPDTASALTLALSASGYRVQRADSVGAALRSDLGGVDLVLSDVNLPDGDGRALLRHLHQQTGLPTIVLSGQPGGWSPQDEGAIFARLTKPVAMERLMETIDRAVAAARQR